MAYLVKNVTTTSGDYILQGPDGPVLGIEVFVADIPNVGAIKWKRDQTIDLEELATTTQIEQSRHLKVHIKEGRLEIVP